MTPSDAAYPALLSEHDALEARFTLLRDDTDLDEGQRALAGDWLEQLNAARGLFEAELAIAFIAGVGQGKTTLVSAAAGLRRSVAGGPKKWSVLPVGDGRTSLGETWLRFEPRADIALTVDPMDEASLRRELHALAADSLDRKTGALAASADKNAGEELYSLLRAWLFPDAEDRRAALKAEATRADDLAALERALVERIDFAARCQPKQWIFTKDEAGLEALQSKLTALMEGELADAPAPARVHVAMPAGDTPKAALIDTQGLDSGASELLIRARPDLQRLLNDPNTLLVLCSAFESAPDTATLSVLQAISALPEPLSARGRALRVIVIDKRDDANDRRGLRKRTDRLGECRERLRAAQLDGLVPDDAVLAIDARTETEALASALNAMIEQARAMRIELWREVVAAGQSAITAFQDAERKALTRELDLRLWWAWDAALASAAPASRDPLIRLAEHIRYDRGAFVQHWSHIRAAVGRRGRYSKLDLADVAAWLASSGVARRYLEALKQIRSIARDVLSSEPDQHLHGHALLRQRQFFDAVMAYHKALHDAWYPHITEYFTSPRADSLWEDCRIRWGRGSGYVNDISARFHDEAARARLRLPVRPKFEAQRLPARPPLLQLQRVTLSNYRCVTQKTLPLGPLTVLVGDNGQGKTTWLEAIRDALGALIPELGAGEAPKLAEANVRAVIKMLGGVPDRQPQLPLVVSVDAVIQGRALQWDRRIDAPPDETLADEDNALRMLARQMGAEVRSHEPRQLPVLCYYGTQRLWPTDLEADTSRREVGNRLDGYRDALMAASTHRHMLDWMRHFTLVQLQRKAPVVQLQAIERAVVKSVSGAVAFGYDLALEELQLTMEDGTILPFRWLSDGYRNVVAMVADIAWRASVLNPQVGVRAPLLAEGVVLIDEIDLHLHPNWQRRVLADLRRAFPRLQIITTTHSPFIIQSLQPGELVNLDEEIPDAQYTDRSPEDIAEDVMGVELPQRSWRRQQEADVARRYFELLDRLPNSDAAQLAALKDELDALLAPYAQNQAFVEFLRRKRAMAEQGAS